jgi:toxin ParE1/3/4
MAKFQLSNKAVEDLAAIWDYTYETWSERQADKYYLLLIQACQDIADKPNSGKPYEEVAPDIWGYLAYKHLIMYQKVSSNEIFVVRILHASMDLKRRME